MSGPVTQQPLGYYGIESGPPYEILPGLEPLSHHQTLTVKQIRPGCLESMKFSFRFSHQ